MPSLEWIGKDKVVNHHLEVPYRVLEHRYTYLGGGQTGQEIPENNKIIRGDNLEALKALLPQYEGRIKCIYIDPPYNTGNEGWVYNDNVNEPRIRKWLGEVVGKEGEDLSRHDKWLCMMYPRLKLLEKLLSNDGGIIFISINDIEQANLRFICDEIFGSNNFLAQFSWKTDGNFDNQARVKICHEYVLSYLKNPLNLGLPNGVDPSIPETSKIFKTEVKNTVVKNGPKNPMSEIILPEGFPCSVKSLIIQPRKDSFPYYSGTACIENYRLKNFVGVESGWSSKQILLEFIKNHFQPVLDSKGQLTRFEITGTGAIEMIKQRNMKSHVISTLSNLGSTQNMGNELKSMGISFDFPKPVKLIEYLFGFYSKKDSIILDSFAGTGVTAHAVLNMNKADGGNRKFILVEMMDYAESITAERVRRVIDGYGEGKSAVPGTGGSFSFYDLGEPLLNADHTLNELVGTEKIRQYVYFMETKLQLGENRLNEPYLLGIHVNTAYYFYYEKERITTLNRDFLATIKTTADGYVMYADLCMLSDKELEDSHITFKKIPRDISKL